MVAVAEAGKVLDATRSDVKVGAGIAFVVWAVWVGVVSRFGLQATTRAIANKVPTVLNAAMLAATPVSID